MDKILSIDNWIPYEAKKELANAAKEARLTKGWKRDTLSEKTGIPSSTIKRYETVGDISLDQFLKLVFVLGDLDKLRDVFAGEPNSFVTLDDALRESVVTKKKRGRL